MELETKKVDGAFVVTLAGTVRADDNQKFEDALRDARFRKSDGLVFDVSGLEYLNSRAISTLMALWMELASVGVKMFVVHPAPLVKRLLKSVGIYTLIPVTESVEDALKSIPGKA